MTDSVFNARSPGEMLRAAREKQGLHIAALAAAIKVAPRKLDALEHDRWDELPDATFVRALAQTVCRTLKIDAAPVLQLLPRGGAVTLEPGSGGLNEPFRERPGRDEPGLSLTAVRPMVVAASLLMVAAVAVYFLPEHFWQGKFNWPAKTAVTADAAAQAASSAAPVWPAASAVAPASVDAPLAAAAGPASAALSLPAYSGDAPAAPTVSAPPLPAPVQTVQPPSPVALPVQQPTVTPPAQGQAVPATGEKVAAAPVAGIVQLSVREASWVELRDANGRTLVSRLLGAGERVGLDGALPMRVTIGNAAATQLVFKGQPFDLAGVTRDNVARVELK